MAHYKKWRKKKKKVVYGFIAYFTQTNKVSSKVFLHLVPSDEGFKEHHYISAIKQITLLLVFSICMTGLNYAESMG